MTTRADRVREVVDAALERRRVLIDADPSLARLQVIVHFDKKTGMPREVQYVTESRIAVDDRYPSAATEADR